ncbi:MAG: hypothetical protein JWP88_1630 [Flaviaesturariibacter sp.]|nr:hypothetical protein [Flaviaesturariibacter sp.]
MKKIAMLFTACVLMLASFAAVSPTPFAMKASAIMIPVGKTGKFISLKELSTISVKDYETLSGRDLKFMDEVGFKMGQKKLRKSINADGTLKEKTAKRFAGKMAGGETGFHLGGFALGFFLGLIGVLIAYVAFNDDYKQNRTKWAWIGLGVVVALSLILIGVALRSVN